MFNDAVPLGIKLAEEIREEDPEDGTVTYLTLIVNPPGDQVIEDGDQIIVIAEDNDTYEPGMMNMVDPGPTPEVEEPEKQPQDILLIGFRRDLDDMINEINEWVAPGSKVHLFNDTPVDERMAILESGGLKEDLPNITIEHTVGNPIFYKDVVKVSPQTRTATIILTEKVEDRDGLSSES